MRTMNKIVALSLVLAMALSMMASAASFKDQATINEDLIDEIDRIMSAQKARGADFENGNIVKRIKALFPIFIPLFISAFKRAIELADAMYCRCYTGGEGRTRMRQMKFSWRDAVAGVVTTLVCVAIILLNIFFENLI